MKLSVIILAILLLVNALPTLAQKKIGEMSWKELVGKQPAEWYITPEAEAVAENVLRYQSASGGWQKNTPFHLPLSDSVKQMLESQKPLNKEITIDNGATITEMRFMAKMYKGTEKEKYKNSFVKALDYLLEAQYPNGGWPQFYPLKKGYYSHITFNDNAMINVLTLLTDISNGKPEYVFAAGSADLEKIKKAVEKGVQCILNTQYKQNGILTAWCCPARRKNAFTRQGTRLRVAIAEWF